jgi:hypothetical protein
MGQQPAALGLEVKETPKLKDDEQNSFGLVTLRNTFLADYVKLLGCVIYAHPSDN